jgi:hypothetical protein
MGREKPSRDKQYKESDTKDLNPQAIALNSTHDTTILRKKLGACRQPTFKEETTVIVGGTQSSKGGTEDSSTMKVMDRAK